MTARDPHSSPTSPQRGAGGVGGGGKLVSARVILLNDSVHNFQIPPRAPGRELYYVVMRKLQIIESDYFDLEYVDKEGIRCWLDHDKTLSKQFGSCKDLIFSLGVKFYTPHPNLLEEEYTRYLFALQIKKDIVNGFLPCNDNTSALLASYLVQMEIGDFLEEEYHDHGYLKTLKILHNPSDNMLMKVMEYHKTHIGLSPAEAEFHLLDTARKVELYGIRMHPAKDHEGLPLNLAVAHMGIIVFQHATKINTFSWAKIRKLSFKRKKFLIKLHPEGYVALFVLWLVEGYYKDTVEFYFESRDECKNFWKKCIEHHAFFRCQAVKKAQRRKTRVVSKGSSFRYSGRTQKQLIEYVRENCTRRPLFERPSSSCRVSSKSPSASRHSGGRLPALHPTSHSAGSTGGGGGGASSGGGGHGGTLNSSASARSRTVSTSSGSHTMASSREHLPHLRSVSQSPPSRRAPPPSRSRSLGAEGEDSLHPGAPASDAQSGHHRCQTPQHHDPAAAAAASGSGGQGGRGGGGGVAAADSGAAHHTNANDPSSGSAVTLGRVLCIDRVSYSTGSVSHESSGSDELRQQQQQQHQQQQLKHQKHQHQKHQHQHHQHHQHQQQKQHSQSLPRVVSAGRVSGEDKLDARLNGARKRTKDAARRIGDAEEIPYVLHKRHISPSPSGAHTTPRNMGASSYNNNNNNNNVNNNPIANPTTTNNNSHSHSSSSGTAPRTKSPSCPPKSPKVLREEYLSRQRRVDRAEIEQLKAELRSHGPLTGPVSTYRLPPVNAYSALDDTLSSPTPAECPAARLDLLSRLARPRSRQGQLTSHRSQPQIGRHRQPLYLSSSSGSECSLDEAWLRERRMQPDSVSEFDLRIQTPRARSLASSSAGSAASSASSLEERLTRAGRSAVGRRSQADSSSSSSAAAGGSAAQSLLTAAAVADVLRVPMDLSTTSESSGEESSPPRQAVVQQSSSSSSRASDDEDDDGGAGFLLGDRRERSREPSISSQLDQAEAGPDLEESLAVVSGEEESNGNNGSGEGQLRRPSVPGLMVTCPSPQPTPDKPVPPAPPIRSTPPRNAKTSPPKSVTPKSVTPKSTPPREAGPDNTPPPPPPPKPPRSLVGSSPSSSGSSSSGSVDDGAAPGPEDPYEAQFESSCTEADGEVPLEEEEPARAPLGPVPPLPGASPIVYLNSQYRDDDDDDDDEEDDDEEDTEELEGAGTPTGGGQGHGNGNSGGNSSGGSGRFSLEETVERNLQCGLGGGPELVDSSLERVPSEEDGDEVDEFVLDEESSSSENDSDEDSASEGSEDIEPFPPPPPELLAFSEEDEEAVAAAERGGTNGYHSGVARQQERQHPTPPQ